jgi:serine/threonine protein kinase/Tfp pilus assembly protein PilF
VLPTREGTSAAAAPTDLYGGAGFPDYEILDELGRGGMGVVYRARQVSLKREVALKMILAGAYADPGQRARFHREAESVAHLDHPNIIKIYEVGETKGHAYFSMEFVDGSNLARVIAGKPQAPRTAAALIEILARAIQHAHERGIIHRDLKPANILLAPVAHSSVTLQLPRSKAPGAPREPSAGLDMERWTPKITDFGLAKQVAEATDQTQSGTVMGSPNYMAPEQASGKTKHVTAAADVYGLGAILYEMLTGVPPFLGETAASILVRVVGEDVVAPRRLQSKVPRDLETICLKCLQKAPARRYASALALAEDLRRFLGGEAIQARPIGPVERAFKWARRRPALAALLGMSALALGSVLGISLWFNVRLQREVKRSDTNFQLALQAVDKMLTEVGDEQLVHEPRMEKKRRALLESALEFYEHFLREQPDNLDVRVKLTMAHKRKADILRLLGQDDLAQQAYDQAIAALTELAEGMPKYGTYQHALADAYNWKGELLRTSNPVEATAAIRRALDLENGLARQFPGDPQYPKEQARCWYNLGLLLKAGNELTDARAALDKAIAILQDLSQRYTGRPSYREELARAYLNLGPVLRQLKEYGAARQSYQHAIELLRALVQTNPDMPDYRHELGVTYNNLAFLLGSLKPYTGAVDAYQQARELFEKLVKDYPAIPIYRKELANTSMTEGRTLAGQGNFTAAAEAWHAAQQILEGLLKEFPDKPDYHGEMGLLRRNLGRLKLQAGDRAGARQELTAAVAHLRRALEPHPRDPTYLPDFEKAQKELAEAEKPPPARTAR